MFALQSLGWCLVAAGRYDESRRTQGDTLEKARALRARRFEAALLAMSAEAALAQGRRAEALSLVRQGLEASTETSRGFIGATLLGLLALFSAKKIEHKMALRVVQNGLITLKDCRVPEADRLQKADSFKDVAKVLRMTRAGVAWFAVGCGRGSYEHALRYSTARTQFGKPIGGFQLVQEGRFVTAEIGPLIVGLEKPVQIVTLGAEDSDIVNTAAMASFNIWKSAHAVDSVIDDKPGHRV